MNNVSLEDYKDSLKSINQYPIPYILNNNVIKLLEEGNKITVGIIKDSPKPVLDKLKNYHKGKDILFVLINPSELTSFISKSTSNYGIETTLNIRENDLNKLANDAPIINLVNSIIIDGINRGASDIHIEGYLNEVILRYRIDGVLIESEKIKRNLFLSISSRIKIMANLNIMERRLPQDGRCSVTLEDSPVDLRVSIIPLSEGESIVLRLFIKKRELLTLEELGFSSDKIEVFNMLSDLPHGLILITGPTGSGKTTTLNALIQRINCKDKKIITIEDPVENTIPGVNQIQVNHDIDLSFSGILRRVLRQDPDIIMIGEIRDRETAGLVIRAALTGHLVLSTLHTNDAASSLSRLKDLGIPDYLITAVLKASYSQRLIRTLCPLCKKKSVNGEYEAIGCQRCSHTGFKGRMAIVEGFILDRAMESFIMDGAKTYEIQNLLAGNGMELLYEAGCKVVQQGLTTSRELKRILVC
jgi:type II secretory ATPase GspE/PulE/Tfp pilus assembly ATPase PilB-like protein